MANEFDSTGQYACVEDLGHGFHGIVQGCIAGQHRGGKLRQGQKLQVELCYDAECSLAAHKEPCHIKAYDILVAASAKMNNVAPWQHGFNAKNVVPGYAILDCPESASTGNDIATDTGGLAACGIGRVVKPFFRALCLQKRSVYTWLDNSHKVRVGNIKDFIHAQHGDHNAGHCRHTAAGKAGTATARVHSHVFLLSPVHEFREFLCVARAVHCKDRTDLETCVGCVDAQNLG